MIFFCEGSNEPRYRWSRRAKYNFITDKCQQKEAQELILFYFHAFFCDRLSIFAAEIIQLQKIT